MKNNNKGGSLVELLLVVSLTSVAVAGLSKAIEKSYVTSNVIQTQQVTRDFKNSVYQILNNNCTKFFTDYPDQNNNEKINNMPYIFNRSNQNESIYKGFIETVDITVSNPDQNRIHTFNLYYKYSDKATALRDMKTKDSKQCTATDKRGCYHITCNINYQCPGVPPNPPTPPQSNSCTNNQKPTCKSLDCFFDDRSKSVLTNLCDEGDFLVGVTGNKENDCLGCDDNETLIGTKRKNGNLEPMCLKRDCPAGKIATGIIQEDPDETDPVKFVMNCKEVACENAGEHRVLENGTMVCKPICHGGQRIKIENGVKKCHCPSSMTLDDDGNCISP